MEAKVRRSFVGIGAVVGGGLWAAKSIVILTTGRQPDYLFEVAPIALAAAALGLAASWQEETKRGPLPILLASLALLATTGAGISYLVTGDDAGVFGPALMIGILSIVILLFWVGRFFWKTRTINRWRAMPFLLAWLFVVALPLSGVFAALNERLLEIPLLVLSLAWMWLGIASFASRTAGKLSLEPRNG